MTTLLDSYFQHTGITAVAWRAGFILHGCACEWNVWMERAPLYHRNRDRTLRGSKTATAQAWVAVFW